MSIEFNKCPISGPDKFFGCQYCSVEFQSRQQRIQHTATHFRSKSCTTCAKLLLCINGDWYELHTTPGCDTKGDQQYVPCVAYMGNENETEAFDFVSNTSLNSEVNDNDSDDANDDYNTFDSLSMLEPDIEVNTLPPIVQTLAKLKTNLTISRTKAKKGPDARAQNTTHRKEQKTIQPLVKPPYQIASNQIIQKIKRPCNKTVFMDHRPLGSCLCDICNKKLANFSTLRNHILHQHCPSRKPKERVSCTECGLTLSSPGNLKLHKRIHLKSKAYVCTYCGRGFNQIAGLREHTNQHTGEKPYTCKYCDKRFFRKTALTAHTRIHTGEKPFKCKIENCDRVYMYDIDLKRHKFSAHGIYTKKHICQICSRVFPENKLLKKHIFTTHSTAQFGTF